MTEKSISDLFKAHVDALIELSDAGDCMATKSIACMALLAEGWRCGDPDPADPPPDDGGGEDAESNIIRFASVKQVMRRRAA